MILENFADEMNQAVVIQKIETTIDADGNPIDSTVSKPAILSAYYVGSSANSLISEKYKSVVDAVLIIDPNSPDGYTIEPYDLAVLNGKTYTVILANDVMFQGEVMVVGISEQ